MSRLRAVYAKLESNSEPERARVCQRVAVRASEGQSGVTESHREPERDGDRSSKSHREPERDKENSSRSQRVSESLREASLTFLAYLNIVLLQNN